MLTSRLPVHLISIRERHGFYTEGLFPNRFFFFYRIEFVLYNWINEYVLKRGGAASLMIFTSKLGDRSAGAERSPAPAVGAAAALSLAF